MTPQISAAEGLGQTLNPTPFCMILQLVVAIQYAPKPASHVFPNNVSYGVFSRNKVWGKLGQEPGSELGCGACRNLFLRSPLRKTGLNAVPKPENRIANQTLSLGVRFSAKCVFARLGNRISELSLVANLSMLSLHPKIVLHMLY